MIHFLVVIGGEATESTNLNRVGNNGDLELNPEAFGASPILDLKPTGTNKEGHNPNVASGKKVKSTNPKKRSHDYDFFLFLRW